MSYDYLYEKLLSEACHFIEIERFESALSKLDKILSDNPNDSAILYLRAQCLHNLNRYDEAKDCCDQALKSGYSICECNYLMADIFAETDKFVEAELRYIEALRLEPRRADIMASYGILMLETGHKSKAQQLLTEALKLDPDDEVVLHYNFYYHLIVNKKADQVEALKQYMKFAGNEQRKLINIGAMEYCNGNFKSAYENFRQAYLLDPTNEEILEILQIAEEESNLLYFPQRIINKIGGPIVLWIATIAIFIIFYLLHMYKAAIITAINYIILYAYMKITPILCKAIIKRNLL